jgi:hypothetical protein
MPSKRRRVVSDIQKKNQEVNMDVKAALLDAILERQFIILSLFLFEPQADWTARGSKSRC